MANTMASTSYFDRLFQPSWAFDHFVQEGDLLKLKLDNYCGAGFGSNLADILGANFVY